MGNLLSRQCSIGRATEFARLRMRRVYAVGRAHGVRRRAHVPGVSAGWTRFRRNGDGPRCCAIVSAIRSGPEANAIVDATQCSANGAWAPGLHFRRPRSSSTITVVEPSTSMVQPRRLTVDRSSDGHVRRCHRPSHAIAIHERRTSLGDRSLDDHVRRTERRVALGLRGGCPATGRARARAERHVDGALRSTASKLSVTANACVGSSARHGS
jgi:hypothetical protein